MVLLKNFRNIFKIPELTKKLLFTLMVIVVYRLGSFIPVVGINTKLLAEYISQHEALGGFLRYIDLFSGGALQQCTLFALGIMPYITASLMMQLLTVAVPQLEQLSKEGDYGRKVINQYMRYLALALSIGYSLGIGTLLESQNFAITPGFGFKAMLVLSITTGSMFVMWLGDQISLHGLGNGSSIIIFAGIVSRLPSDVVRTIHAVQVGTLSIVMAVIILIIFLTLIACVVFLEKGERKVPVQYARRVVGQRVYAGQSTYIPFRINNAGVMPVMFASSVLNVPIFIVSILSSRFVSLKFLSQWFEIGGGLYNMMEFGFIIFFTFFYTALFFNPTELADIMKKNGGFIPGLRPGKQTANYFDYILLRIGLVGALYLACLALAPNIMRYFIPMPFFFGGTSLLIMVGVALELSSQVESYLIENKYEGFLSSGRMRARATS